MPESIFAYVLAELDKMPRQEIIGLAERSGVPMKTLEKIASRDTKNPGIAHVEALYRTLKSAHRPSASAA
jgi:hypothetical protein